MESKKVWSKDSKLYSRDVERGNSKSRRPRNKSEWINWLLQITAIFLTLSVGVGAIAIAIVFGVFSILAWVEGRSALNQAQLANRLSLASFCAANLDDQQSGSCSQILANFNTTALAYQLGMIPQSQSGHHLSGHAKIAIGVGVGVGGSILVVMSLLATFYATGMLGTLVTTKFLVPAFVKALVKFSRLSDDSEDTERSEKELEAQQSHTEQVAEPGKHDSPSETSSDSGRSKTGPNTTTPAITNPAAAVSNET